MYVGSAELAPRKFSRITGRDPISGRHFLGGLGDSATLPPPSFPSDLAQAISNDFATYRALAAATVGKPIQVQVMVNGWTQYQPSMDYVRAVMAALNALPTWYGMRLAFTDVSQGANGNTGYVSYRILNRNGVRLWEVPASYKLNEGMQTITPSMAAAAGGILTPTGSVPGKGGIGPSLLNPSWLFTADPRPYLPVGQIGAGYVGGVSGRSITMEAVKGVAMTILPVAAGVVAAPLIFGAAGGVGAGAAGAAAGEAIGAAATPAVTGAGVTAGAGITATGLAPTLITAAATTVPTAVATAAPAAGGILGTGVTVPQVSAAIGAAKTALSLAQGHAQAAKNAYVAGDIQGANQNAALAQAYQQQAGGIMAELNQPVIGGIPLWLLAAGAIAAKLLLF